MFIANLNSMQFIGLDDGKLKFLSHQGRPLWVEEAKVIMPGYRGTFLVDSAGNVKPTRGTINRVGEDEALRMFYDYMENSKLLSVAK